MPLRLRAAVLVSGMTVCLAAQSEAAEYQCLKADSSVRIAIEVKKAGHTLPCEVIAEDDKGELAVLYKAQFDREYCPSRLERTKADLEGDGWSCQQTSDVNVVRQEAGEDEGEIEQAVTEPGNVPQGGDLQPVQDGKYILASRQCRQGGETRLIHIEVDNPNNRKPCELMYWADGDVSKPGQLLWRAEHDADFCPRRLETIVTKWIGDGWQCDSDSVELETASVEPGPAPSPAPVAANELAPETPASPETSASNDVAALSSEQAASENTEAVEARPVENQAGDTSGTSDVALEAIIAADAERIGQWMEVEPDIEIAARGDLNDDGADDAVVFLAYQSDQSVYRQYLMSYLEADGGYELASVKLLTGVNPPPAHARVEQIDKGVIWLTLPDDTGSASAPTGYKLRDQQLIEVDAVPATANN